MLALLILIVIFIGLSCGLIFWLLKNDKGEKEPIYALWLAAGFGLIGAVAAGLIEKAVIPVQDLRGGADIGVLLLASLGVGAIEELLKFVPLALFIFPKRYFNEHTDGIIYFAIAGLGFGLPENILYTLQFGAKTGLSRLILTPFFHAALTAVVGYYLVKAKLQHKNPLAIWPVLLLAIVIHGLYDTGLASGNPILALMSVALTLGLSLNFFNLFFRAEDHDEAEGLAVAGHNNFCRSCGAPNPDHHLYCTTCGKRA